MSVLLNFVGIYALIQKHNVPVFAVVVFKDQKWSLSLQESTGKIIVWNDQRVILYTLQHTRSHKHTNFFLFFHIRFSF
jgi:hypothetical protein